MGIYKVFRKHSWSSARGLITHILIIEIIHKKLKNNKLKNFQS